MFTQAGFNPRAHKLGIVAQIHRRNWRDWRRAELIEFESGELAWYGSGGISWGTCADLSFWSFVRLGTLEAFGSYGQRELKACDVDTRKRTKVWA